MVTTAYDSLVIGEVIEVWGPPGGIPSLNPMCPGAVFRIQPPFSLGAPQPTTDFVATLIVDGEKPFGDRASDRTIVLNVLIKAPDYKTLAGARELLLKTIDQQHWPLTWTRASGADPGALPLVLDCFRAQPSAIPLGGPEDYRVQGRSQYETQVTVTFEALPYGRSDAQNQVAFAAPIASINAPPAPPAPIVLDAFSTINSTQCTQSSLHIVGPNSCCWDPQNGPFFRPDGQNCPLTYAAPMAGAPVSFAGMTSLTMWLGLASRYYFNCHPRGQTRVVLGFSLTDDDGVVLSWSEKSIWLPVAADPQTPCFTQVTAHIPQNSATFDYLHVVSYALTITNRAPRWDTPGGELRWTVAYLDALTAQPSSNIIASPSVRGNIYTLYGVTGTHRAPVSMQFQGPPSAGAVTTVTAAGPGTYTVPGGTIYLKVEAVGGGGAGATQTVAGDGGGGGGGEYAAELIFPATPAAVIQYSVGAGDTAGASGRPTTFGPAPNGTLAVNANGGVSAVQNSVTGGTGGTGSGNTVHFNGGAGRTASGSVGGGGGSSGGNASAGLTPTGTAATVFTAAGANTWTCPAGVTQVYAECWGGGASGGTGSSSSNGAGGGGGEYAAAFIAVTPGNVYNYTVAAGGAAVGSGSGLTGNAGASSTFTGNAGAIVTAHGGIGGFATGGSQTGPNGGSGSTNTVHFNGGAGGGNTPYSGSGGSSAGTAAVGNPGSRYGGAGGTAPSGGGNGGAGTGSSGGNGTAGTAPGGGGGGTYFNSTTSGAGATGQVRLTYPGGAPTNNGASAVAGGGAGGAGGPSSNTPGSAGSAPGGAGGGADSGGSSEAGGAGATGQLKITPFASAAFKTLIVHRPGAWSPLQLNPFVPVGAGLIAPGATEYTVPSLISGINADFNGTYCTSMDTEILTASGWRLPDELTGSETVLTLNMETGLSEWQPLSAIHIFPARERKMLPLENANHSSLSTLDHRWPVKYQGKRVIQRSSELNSRSGIIRRAVCVNQPSEAKYSDALVELVAWYTTEGHRRKDTNRGRPGYGKLTDSLVISQSAKANAPYVERIRAALTALYGSPVDKFTRHWGRGVHPVPPAEWRETCRPADHGMVRFRLNSSAGRVITEYAPGFDKVVRQEFVTSLTRAQLALFLDTCIAADGSTRRAVSTRYIEQKVPDRLDAIEIAALLLGFSTNRFVSRCGMTLSIGVTDVCHPVPKRSRRKTEREFVTYTGQVWCPETPNSTWLARRNGKIYFTGNTVLLTNFSFNSPTAARTISVTVKQYEVLSGTSWTVSTTPISIVPNTQAVNGLLVAGTLTLPPKAVASDNTGGYYTVLVSDTNGSDRWMDCLFLDVQGQTVIINEPSNGYINYYFDEPDPCHDLGNYLGSQLGRPNAISVTDAMTISGGPLTIEPGTNTLMAYAQEGAPSISLSYWPRWFSERLE